MQGWIKPLVAVVIVIVVVAGVYAYEQRQGTSGYGKGQTTQPPATTSPSNTTSTTNTTGKSQGFEITKGVEAACKNIGNGTSIGQNIKWLLDNHGLFHFVLHEYPGNMTLVWIITGPDKASLQTLATHILQMECVIKNGGNPRPWDPLFQVDSEISAKYVHTEIKWLNNTAIEVVKKADNECAWEVIKLHAEVVKGFFTTGRVEASQTHEIPQNVLEICKPYLQTTSP